RREFVLNRTHFRSQRCDLSASRKQNHCYEKNYSCSRDECNVIYFVSATKSVESGDKFERRIREREMGRIRRTVSKRLFRAKPDSCGLSGKTRIRWEIPGLE